MTTEDRWTSPSPWCPSPGWWHSDTADATEHEVTALVAALVRALQPECVVETGTNSGQTALAIGRALAGNGHGRLWTLETDGAMAARAALLLDGLPAIAAGVSSLHWEPPQGVDLAWIDSGPAEGAPGLDWASLRRDEIARWLPWFTPGAVIGVHDTAPHHPVMRALQPLFQAAGMQYLNLRTPRGVALAQVPG